MKFVVILIEIVMSKRISYITCCAQDKTFVVDNFSVLQSVSREVCRIFIRFDNILIIPIHFKDKKP